MTSLNNKSLNDLIVQVIHVTKEENQKQRYISTIAWEIKRLWKKPYFGAVPYLNAMTELATIKDYYFQDSAREIILYFLGNANTFRGDDAKRIKAELKSMLKAK